MSLLNELLSSFTELSPTDKEALTSLAIEATGAMEWVPNPGPQTMAYLSNADELFYGGAAGGGKTDLLCGLATTAHKRSLILRREGTDLGAIENRLEEIFQGRDGYNGQKRLWRRDGRWIELGSCPHEKDKFAYQGQPHDLKAFDELTQFSESQYTYIIGWNRTTAPGQRCRIVSAGNPPSTPAGQWVKKRWGPWLDRTHPHPAAPGELCWFTTIDGEDVEVDFDWRGVDEKGEEIAPRSRTFIPALLSDNPFVNAEYRAAVQAMPEPLRSQLLYGDFEVGEETAHDQIIPTAWIRAAQKRWDKNADWGKMRVIGLDVAQGGADETCAAPRYANNVIGELVTRPGSETPDGDAVAALIAAMARDRAVIAVDMGGGYGGGASLRLRDINMRVVPMLASNAPTATGANGVLRFSNMRAQWWWRAREKLDPSNRTPWALPPDEELVADLAAPRWRLGPSGVVVEPKEAVRKRLGRSTNKGDAVIMAMDCPWETIEAGEQRDSFGPSGAKDYDWLRR